MATYPYKHVEESIGRGAVTKRRDGSCHCGPKKQTVHRRWCTEEDDTYVLDEEIIRRERCEPIPNTNSCRIVTVTRRVTIYTGNPCPGDFGERGNAWSKEDTELFRQLDAEIPDPPEEDS